MKIKASIAVLAAFLFGGGSMLSQPRIIRGIITDATDGTPVPFAQVALLQQDSVRISGTHSTIQGYFEMQDYPLDSHFLFVTSSGYDSTYLRARPYPENDTLHILLRPSVISLDEVVIQARSVITNGDRKVIFPTREQVRTATDGVDLIRKMQLSRMMTDPVSGEITMSGNGNVQLRINGVLVTSAEVASIQPADILRIEYHDEPGARYGNADVVIDYIIRRHESGGHINGVLFNSLGGKRTSADDRISLTYNYKKSEFSAHALFVQRKQDWTREYDERLAFPDHELHRIEVGEPTPFNKKVFSTTFNYSLSEKDRYFLNVQFRYIRNDFPNGYEDRKSKLYVSGSELPLSVFDHTKEKSNSPALDLYYQRNLKHEQVLIFNLVATYIDTDSRRLYREGPENSPEAHPTEISSCVSGNKYSLIAEGIYEKKIMHHKFSTGVKHLQSYTDNTYSGTIEADVSLIQAESSLYAEYTGKYGKWGFTGNVEGMRLYYRQKNRYTEKFAVQPSARISFEPGKDLYIRYKTGLRNVAPSLAAMNGVEQAIDAWQVRRGNPDLTSFRVLGQSFSAGYDREFFGVDVQVGYEYEFDPIMESVFYEDGKFIRMHENQRSFQNLNAEATLKLKPWKEHLSIAVTPRINRYISTGNEYLHTYTLPELRINLDFTYGNWLANFTTITPSRFMYGEQLTKSDQMHTLMAGYKTADYSLMIGMLNPFTSEYKAENKNWSSLDRIDSKIHTIHNKSILVRLGFNLNYGKKIKGANKRTHNADTDSGIMQGGRT